MENLFEELAECLRTETVEEDDFFDFESNDFFDLCKSIGKSLDDWDLEKVFAEMEKVQKEFFDSIDTICKDYEARHPEIIKK